MKLLIVCPYYYPSKLGGGVKYVVKTHFEEFKRRGIKVRILTTDLIDFTNGDLIKQKTTNQNGIQLLKTHLMLKSFPVTLNLRKILFEVKNSDIIFLHDTRTFQNIIILQIAKVYKKPIMFQPHGSLRNKDFTLSLFYRMFIAIIDLIFTKPLSKYLKKGNGFTYVLNESERDDAVQQGFNHETICKINNFYPMRDVSKDLFAQLLKYKFDLLSIQKKIKISYIGRLNHRKRIDSLISFYSVISKIVSQNGFELDFTIAGHPEDYSKEDILQKAQSFGDPKFLTVREWITEEEKEEILKASHFVILLSDFETFPISLLEGFSFGCLAIVKSDLGIIEIVKEYEIGHVIEQISNSSLKSLGLEIINDVLEYSENISNYKIKMNKIEKCMRSEFTPNKTMNKIINEHFVLFNQ